jgi:uncharacterized membrane protein
VRSVNEPTIFSAEITPHRSLNGAGFLAAMLVFTAASLALVVMFVTAGAWPVAGFLGLDVALVYFAFKVNFRRADAQELVRVTASTLSVRRISHKGEVAEFTLNPLWVRLHRDIDPDYGMQRLILVSRGKSLTVAEHLSPPERESFANALSAAIAEARRGLTVTRFDDDGEPPGNRVDGPRRPA